MAVEKKFPMTTKPSEGGEVKALVVGPRKKELFLWLSKVKLKEGRTDWSGITRGKVDPLEGRNALWGEDERKDGRNNLINREGM